MNDLVIIDGKTLHPDMEKMLKARETSEPAITIQDQRKAWAKYSRALSKPHPLDMRVEDRGLELSHGKITVRIYTPSSTTSQAPCVLYSHGGGFMKGDLDSSDTFAWGVAEDTKAIVISVDYRLAPEYPFPAAFEDIYDTLC